MKFTHSRTLFASSVFAVIAGCTASSATSHTRMMAAHNALVTQGLAQVGAISNGNIGEGQSLRVSQTLEVGCYTFLAFGADSLRDVELSVSNPQGQVVATETVHDAQAGLRFCPTARGAFQVSARAASGGGAVALSSWRGGAETASPRAGGLGAVAAGGAGSCGEPLPLELGQTVNGDTSQAQNHLSASCANGEAPELVYRMRVPRRMQVTLASEQEYDGAIYILRQCSASNGRRNPRSQINPNNANEVACNDDDQQIRRSRIVQVLEPGDYYVVVDGFGNDSGAFTLAATAQDIPSPEELCQQAPSLTLGQAMQGDTARDVDGFHASCANHASGPDRVFRFDVAQESRVQASLETPNFDGALHIRRACAQETSEIACNDDAESTRQSRLNVVLPPGPYFVYADAYGATGGSFTLQVDAAPVAGAGVTGDSCQDAQALTVTSAASTTQGNLLAARDDVTTACGAGQDTADLVYRVDVPSRGRLKLWFSYMDESLREAGGLTTQIVRACGGTAANNSLACRALSIGDDAPLDAVLTAGTYYVVVEAARARAFGRFTLNASLEDSAAAERACRTARVLTPGRTVTGTTAGTDMFQASCAGSARSPENLYRLVLRRRQHVRLEVTSTNPSYDPAIYLRATCTDQSTERACVDDTNGTTNAVIEEDLDAGTYTVFVDGFSNGNAGPYTLRADVTAAGSGPSTSTPRPAAPTP